jgi:hypothetical protein
MDQQRDLIHVWTVHSPRCEGEQGALRRPLLFLFIGILLMTILLMTILAHLEDPLYRIPESDAGGRFRGKDRDTGGRRSR